MVIYFSSPGPIVVMSFGQQSIIDWVTAHRGETHRIDAVRLAIGELARGAYGLNEAILRYALDDWSSESRPEWRE